MENDINKPSKVKKRIWITVVSLLAVLLILGIIGLSIFRRYYNLLDYQPADQSEVWEEVLPEEPEDEVYDGEETLEDISGEEAEQIESQLQQNIENMARDTTELQTECFNILLIGVDARSNSYAGRSDAMILVSINKESKQIVMTSLLRDMYVSISGKGSNRLNAAYAYGGSSLLTETIKANLGIEVDRCVAVNFYLIMDAVNALGGVELELSSDEIRVMNSYIKEQNKLLGEVADANLIPVDGAGKRLLNGSQALAYARVRYVGTDFARTERQRRIIELCIEKAKSLTLAELDALMVQFLPRVRTDLTQGDCASLLLLFLDISDYKLETFTIPVEGSWSGTRIDGKSVLSVDFGQNTRAWYEKVNGEREEDF